jgi:hypothetical protein
MQFNNFLWVVSSRLGIHWKFMTREADECAAHMEKLSEQCCAVMKDEHYGACSHGFTIGYNAGIAFERARSAKLVAALKRVDTWSFDCIEIRRWAKQAIKEYEEGK